MIEKKINVMKDNLRTLGTNLKKTSETSLKMDNDEVRLSSASKWKSNFLIDYILSSSEIFSELMNELEYKDQLIKHMELKILELKSSSKNEANKHHKQTVKKLYSEFNKLPIKNKVYKKMLIEWLTVNLR